MKKILELQKLDAELIKLQKEISNNPDKKNAQSMKTFVMEAQQTAASLDREAKSLINELAKLKEVQAKGIALVEKFTSQYNDGLDVEKLKELEQKMKQALKHLNELDNRLLANNEKVKNVLKEFNNNKERSRIAREKHALSKEKFDEYYKQKEPKLNELKQKILELQKEVNSSDLNKYKLLRQDNIFPAYVPLAGTRCGGCRMELPSNSLEKIKKLGKLECEQCRRIIYVDNK